MKGRVLLIDDEAEIRRNLSVGLMQEDYDVVACPDGISAIHELDNARGRGRHSIAWLPTSSCPISMG